MAQCPLFSVVIPTHNRVRRLEQALRSVQAQTMDDYEIVVVDDASRDDTPRFLAGVSSDRCRTLRNDPNRGVSASRNRGCAAARGEFLVFLDDDDQLRPEALARLEAKHRADPALDFMWGGRAVHEKDPAGRLVSTQADDWRPFVDPLRDSAVLSIVLRIATNSAFAIRRSLFAQLGGFDEQLRVSEDRDLFIRLARHGSAGAAVPDILIDVDQHFTDSLSRNTGMRSVPGTDLKVIAKHREFLERPEHCQFLNTYLMEVYCGYLHADERAAALRIVVDLHRRQALSLQLVRMYLRHAPEFRALKRLLRYDSIRRLKNASAP